jgi:hypothetical protein
MCVPCPSFTSLRSIRPPVRMRMHTHPMTPLYGPLRWRSVTAVFGLAPLPAADAPDEEEAGTAHAVTDAVPTEAASVARAQWAAYAAWLHAGLTATSAPPTAVLSMLGTWAVRVAPSPITAALRERWMPVLVVAAAALPAAAAQLPVWVDALPVPEALQALLLALSEAEGVAPTVATACKRELTRLLHRPDGVRLVVPALLAAARGRSGGPVPAEAKAGVARLLASVPARAASPAAYYAQVAPQVHALLGADDVHVATTAVRAVYLGLQQQPAATRALWLWPIVAPWTDLTQAAYAGAAPAAPTTPLLERAASARLLRRLTAAHPVPHLLADALLPGPFVGLHTVMRLGEVGID